MARLRRWLIRSHRYLGIGLGLLVVVWFVSGIAMIYTGGMPSLSDETRLERQDPLDPASVRVTAGEAAAGVGLADRVERAILGSVEGRPVYRFDVSGRTFTVFADSGERMEPVDTTRARRIAAHFAGLAVDRIRYEARLTRADQWTIVERGEIPLHRLAVADGAGSRVYVSEHTGEVVQRTTGMDRAVAWIAAIPHWLYFTPLRLRAELWRQVVLWTSGVACVLALLGLVLAVVQLRTDRPFRIARIRSYIPYRGWMRWHYLTGAVFGIFVLTWLFSGLLSMEPWGWAAGHGLNARSVRDALAGRTLDLGDFPAVEGSLWSDVLPDRSIKEIAYLRILGEPYWAVRATDSERRPGRRPAATGGAGRAYGASAGGAVDEILVHAGTLEARTEPFPEEALLDRVRASYPEVGIAEVSRLDAYDAYHYGRDGSAALPVLRVEMADPDRTWLYLDLQRASLATRVDRYDRVERWLYHGLHSLDFRFWYDRRPLWDVAVVALLLGGLATSGIGVFLGGRRLLRTMRRG